MSLRRLKRAKGMVYHLDIYLPSGKRVIRSLKTTDKTEAERLYHSAVADLLERGIQKSAKYTLGDLRQRVLAFYEVASPSTIKPVHSAWKSFVDILGQGTQIEKVTRSMVDSWRVEAAQTLQPQTINMYAAMIKAGCNKAIEWGVLKTNPLTKLKPLDAPDGGKIR